MKKEFPNITENLALNFCNSKVIRYGKLVDLFDSVDTFKEWLENPIENNEDYNRQLSVMYGCLEDNMEFKELIELREEITKMLFLVTNDNNVIPNLKTDIEFFISNNPFTLIFVENSPLLIPVKKGIDGIKTILFLSLVEMIKADELNKLTKCADEDCRLIFINTSGRRRWCSMKLCGNRNKVDNFINRNKKE